MISFQVSHQLQNLPISLITTISCICIYCAKMDCDDVLVNTATISAEKTISC